ncbi:MAG: hypothetical protein ACI8VT_002708, partial [Saprospiraceae bacterium]
FAAIALITTSFIHKKSIRLVILLPYNKRPY